MSQSTSYLKYLKYKAKYMQLKLELEGGADTVTQLWNESLKNQLNTNWTGEKLKNLVHGSSALRRFTQPFVAPFLKYATGKEIQDNIQTAAKLETALNAAMWNGQV